MRLDTKQALRPVLSLPNPSAMQGARWGEARPDTKQALRPFLSLPNPSELRPEEVPVGPSAKCIAANAFWQTPASAGIADTKCLMSLAGARVYGLVAIEKVSSAHALVAASFGYRLPMVRSGAEQVLFNEL